MIREKQLNPRCQMKVIIGVDSVFAIGLVQKNESEPIELMFCVTSLKTQIALFSDIPFLLIPIMAVKSNNKKKKTCESKEGYQISW